VVQAQAGTGKTAGYCIAVLQNMDVAVLQCQALVLVPTRELAQGVTKVMAVLGKHVTTFHPNCSFCITEFCSETLPDRAFASWEGPRCDRTPSPWGLESLL
jgi:superfamily II DNA/RNA helicase